MKQLRNYRNDERNGENQNGMELNNPKIAEALSKYGGMDEDALVNELLKSVRASRQNGTYNPAQISSYIEILKPHLNQAQYEKLTNIINIINSENV